MPVNSPSPPSFATLSGADREQINELMARGLELIARSRANIAQAQRLLAASFDRLAESQKLIGRIPAGPVLA